MGATYRAVALVRWDCRGQPAAPFVENRHLDGHREARRNAPPGARHGHAGAGGHSLVPRSAPGASTDLVLPGARVGRSVLVELSNPEVERAAFDASGNSKARSRASNLRAAEPTTVDQKAVATAEANQSTAQLVKWNRNSTVQAGPGRDLEAGADQSRGNRGSGDRTGM